MFFRLLKYVATAFVLLVTYSLGRQVYLLSEQIGTKDRSNLLGVVSNTVVEAQKIDLESVTQLEINDSRLTVELADTPKERAIGLMFREYMAPNAGMLFVFNKPGKYSFWMKNTKIPLDMLWINENLEIVHIEENVPICVESVCPSYKSPILASYVLEVNAGWVRENEIGLKDVVKFK